MDIKKPLNDTKVLTAGAIGIASTVAGEICSWILLSFGLGKYSTYQLNSLIVTCNKQSMIIGFTVNVLLGGIIGASVYLTLIKWGEKHIIMVSLLYTMVAWLLLEFVFNAVVEKNIVTSRTMSGYYNQLITAVVHAVAKGLMLQYFVFNKIRH